MAAFQLRALSRVEPDDATSKGIQENAAPGKQHRVFKAHDSGNSAAQRRPYSEDFIQYLAHWTDWTNRTETSTKCITSKSTLTIPPYVAHDPFQAFITKCSDAASGAKKCSTVSITTAAITTVANGDGAIQDTCALSIAHVEGHGGICATSGEEAAFTIANESSCRTVSGSTGGFAGSLATWGSR